MPIHFNKQTKTVSCPPDPMAADPLEQTTVSVNYLLSDITDIYENFFVSAVGYSLTSGDTSPFYRALVEPNIGSDCAPTTGVGFEQKRIDALLHMIELSQKHESSNFGFHLAVGAASLWNHDGAPLQSIQIGKIVTKFKEDLKKNPKLLQDKVKQYLKDNTHKLVLAMHPDETYISNKENGEKERLEKLVSGLDDEAKVQVQSRGKQLLELQNSTEDLSCLPSLKVTDLDKKIKPEPIEIKEAGWSFIQTCVQPTNGVTYLRMASNLEGLSEELMPYVPLFCQVITSIGAGGHDYLWVSQQQELYTGGLSASPLVVPHHTEAGRIQRAVLFSSYALEKNFSKMLDLWTLVINSPDFSDSNRLSTLIRMAASDLASSLSDNGHHYAITSSASMLNVVGSIQENFFGFSQVQTMKSVAEKADLTEIIYKLQAIGEVVLDKSSIRLSLNATPASLDRSVHGIKTFLGHLKGEAEMTNIFPEVDQIKVVSHKTQYELPFNVNYMAKSYPGVRYTEKDYTPLSVLANLMSRKFLHREIREKGGAYGGGAKLDSGVFSLYSYRDPRSLETLDVFKRCIDWASKGEFSAQDVDEAKLGVFQKIDKPVPPCSRGQVRFLYDISDDMRQKNRDRLFRVTADDLKRVANTYLKSEEQLSGTAFLGPANPAVQGDKSWKIVKEEQPPAQPVQ